MALSETFWSGVLQVVGQIVVAIVTGFCLWKVSQLKHHINSRMDELIALAKDVAYARGRLDGEASEKLKQEKQSG